ncbi:hypothetical protein [Microcystis phage MinS1]|nr:hypothetical protein [Microcystis phage MinS1]
MTFRAIWPITDERLPFTALCAQAWPDIPRLLRRAHATPTGHGRFTAAPSAHIPGSGRITDWVLIYECPARHDGRTPITDVIRHPHHTHHQPTRAGSEHAA